MRRLVALALFVAAGCGGPGIPARQATVADPTVDLVEVPGAAYVMGDARGEPDEKPREVVVEGFSIMRREVTNQQFAGFVKASKHVTDPEKSGRGHVWPGTWKIVEGADWRHPNGPSSSIEGLDQHPVVQVSWRDASAFCAHFGMRLPTEEEWELAARGVDGRRYPWGNESPTPTRANRGASKCCAEDDVDGYGKTAPVGSYYLGRSPTGLDDMAGNVWEWTASRHLEQQGKLVIRGGGWGNDDHCLRVSYRHANPPARGLDMVGFRCAK